MSATPNYQDAGHRPHARHDGEPPQNPIIEAPYHLNVTLDTWGPVDNLFPSLYDALQSNWGDAPSRTVTEDQRMTLASRNIGLDHLTGWDRLNAEQRGYVESCFAGKTLPQVLESITFRFLVDGCTRACTHQLVRTRIGAAMMQHGGRDNDWRHRPWVMPETIRRACLHDEGRGTTEERWDDRELRHCVKDWGPISKFINDEARHYNDPERVTLRDAIEAYLQEGRDLYAALVDAGIPWEDARRLLWMGSSTYIHVDYNYLALQGVMAKRLEHIMDWEINCVMQLAKREINMKCPPLFGKYLRSMSDIRGQAAMAGLQSWPPDGKYPNPYERCECGHAKASHVPNPTGDPDYVGSDGCMECFDGRTNFPDIGYRHEYSPVDTLPREHRPEQNPFWVLHPESMAGGSIRWIPTNGTYPHGEVK